MDAAGPDYSKSGCYEWPQPQLKAGVVPGCCQGPEKKERSIQGLMPLMT